MFRSVIPVTDEQNLKVTINVCLGTCQQGAGWRHAVLTPCLRSCVLSHTSARSLLLYTQPCIMHGSNANMVAVICMKSLSVFSHPTGKPFTGFICRRERWFTPCQCVCRAAQDSCQSHELKRLLHQWIIDKIKLSTACFLCVCCLNGIMLIVLTMTCYL